MSRHIVRGLLENFVQNKNDPYKNINEMIVESMWMNQTYHDVIYQYTSNQMNKYGTGCQQEVVEFHQILS